MDYCKELLLSPSSARSTNYQFLDDKKKEAENKTRKNTKRKVIDETLVTMKTKNRMAADIKVLKQISRRICRYNLKYRDIYAYCQVKQYEKECKGQTKKSRNY